MYTNEQILLLCDSCNFDETHDNNWYAPIIKRLNFDTSGIEDIDFYEAGASKVVFGWTNKDWVVKIPLQGYSRGECDWEDEEEAEEKDDFYYFEGACNSKNEWDYCQKEVENYKEACSAGLEMFFPETKLIGLTPTHGFPIYLQRKVDEVGVDNGEEKGFTSAQISKAVELSNDGPIYRWQAIASAIQNYGEELTQRLFNFINDFDIDDLHPGNLGFMNGRFVIFDFSGFSDEW